jgi:dTDP-4-dehydrorhamnose 3,5-epimerase
MRFEPIGLNDAWLVLPEAQMDDRGWFARTFCEQEFAARRATGRFVQCNVSFNYRRGTLRGMHYQAAPKEEAKLVRCTRGAAYDVLIDLREGSPTYCRHAAFELTSENRAALYVPAGFAHGFQTLSDETEMFYQMTEVYCPDLARGVRWNDPAFGIKWPISDPILSDRDRVHPDYRR